MLRSSFYIRPLTTPNGLLFRSKAATQLKWDGNVTGQPCFKTPLWRNALHSTQEKVMDEGEQIPETAERAFWSWLGFWLQLLLMGVLAIIGAFFASAAARP